MTSELLARVRAQLAHATGQRMLAVSIDCADAEKLLALADDRRAIRHALDTLIDDARASHFNSAALGLATDDHARRMLHRIISRLEGIYAPRPNEHVRVLHRDRVIVNVPIGDPT